MIKLLGDDIWLRIRQLARASGRKRAAIAYVSSDSDIQFRKSDILIMNASDSAIGSGQTSAAVLRKAFDAGAELFNNPNVHAKVLVFDRTALVGSANLSRFSRDYLYEVAVETDHPAVVGPALKHIDSLKNESERIDEEFIRRISRIKVKRPDFSQNRLRKPRRKIHMHQPQTWLVSVWEEEERADEKEWIESGERAAKGKRERRSSDVPWMRFTGDSSFRRQAKEGDSLIQIWHSLGKKEQIKVYKAEPILLRQPEPNRTRFFIEEFSDADRHVLSWKEFQRIAKRAGLPKTSKSSLRRLKQEQANSIHEMWPK
jgi:hypothetical protein